MKKKKKKNANAPTGRKATDVYTVTKYLARVKYTTQNVENPSEPRVKIFTESSYLMLEGKGPSGDTKRVHIHTIPPESEKPDDYLDLKTLADYHNFVTEASYSGYFAALLSMVSGAHGKCRFTPGLHQERGVWVEK